MEIKDTEKLDLKRLSIDRDTQDEVMDTFKFSHPGEAMECGMLVLSSFAKAKKQGCDMMYFCRENNGKREYFEFNYLKLIDYIKTRPNDTCVHKVELNSFK